MALLLVGDQDLDQLVDLRLRHVPHVLGVEDAERLGGIAAVLHRDAGVVQERDAPLPLVVEQLGPADLGRSLLDDVPVVTHRVHVEVRGRAEDPARLRLPVVRRVRRLVPPLDNVVGGRTLLRQRKTGALADPAASEHGHGARMLGGQLAHQLLQLRGPSEAVRLRSESSRSPHIPLHGHHRHLRWCERVQQILQAGFVLRSEVHVIPGS